MTSDTLHLRDLVSVDADFKPSVQLPFDFDNPVINEGLIRSFIPTSQTIEILTEIARSLDPNSTERARAMVGTFGTGKSDLLLMICNYFGRQTDEPVMAQFYERLRNIDPARAGIIKGKREGQPPFLIVLLQADTVSSFPGFVLHGLQHALEKAGLAHLMNKTRYAAAREQILTWQKEGHARYADLCKTLEEHEKIDVNSLLAALSGPQSDEALRRFARAFKTITGSEFYIYGYSQPHEAYAGVAEALVATGKYSGILLVCDEFTAFLERFQNAIDQQLREFEAETKAIENLAERSGSSSRTQIHFIVATLESFASAAGEIGSRTVAQATERSGGRFKQHSLLVQGSEELIRGAIKRLPASEGVTLLANAQRDDLLELAGEIGKIQIQSQWRDRQWIRNVIVDGAFPLHPLTTYALPLVNQKVAQSQRTMFLFLKDEKGLRGFIQREPLGDQHPGWRRLLTPDLLFDYFRESITVKRSDIHDAFEHAEQQVRTATIDTSLAMRILKIIALCETIGSDLVMRPTKLFLRRALNLPVSAETDLDTALNLLEQVDAIEPPSELGSQAGVYRLPMRGWVSVKNLHRRITNRAQNLPATDVSKLQADHPPEAIDATEYNLKRGSHRKLNAFYVSVSTLRSRERLKSDLENAQNRDGVLWRVITTSDAERSEAQSMARELTAQHSRLIVAIPIAPSHILSALRDYQALQELRKDAELEQPSKPFLEDKGKVGSEYKARLDHELKQLADARQWEWFAAGRGQSGQSSAAIVTLASAVMDKVFPDTPTTSLKQHFKPDDVSSTIIKAVEQIIKGDIQLVKSSKSPLDSVLRIGAVSLGLLQAQQVSGSFEPFSIADPSKGASLASGKIWRRMSEHLAAGKPWASLIRELRQPPYGLYDSILILFLAAFVARNADSIAITKAAVGNRPLDVDPSLLKGMLERPQDYTVRYQPLSEPEKRWLRGIVERGLRVTDFSPSPGTILRIAVATRVKGWVGRQQIPAFALNLSAEQLAAFLPDSDLAMIRAMQLILQSQGSESDLAALLLGDLPHHFGAPEQHATWDQATVDMLLASWMTLCDLLTRLPVVLKEQVVGRAAALFGAENYPPEARWSEIHRWRFHRSAVRAERLQGHPRDLFHLTNLVTATIEQALLDDFARRVVTVGVEYQRWQDLDKLEKVFTELTKARDEIDRAWKEVASGDEIWREGLMRLATGRSVSGVSADRAAAELAAWSAGIAWPACTHTLSVAQIQAIYPEAGPESCQDLARILKRAGYDQQQWREDLQEALPKEFGIQGYTKAEVNTAIKRIETVVPFAASLEARLRRYVLQRIARQFGEGIEAPADAPVDMLLAQWRECYAIPEPNDLSAEAKSVLFHVENAAGDAETLLLTTLPRALGAVGRPVRQWERFDLFETYAGTLHQLLAEISNYQPVTSTLYTWMVGILGVLSRPSSITPPRERARLTELVAAELGAWLREQRLPAFVADLNADELHSIFPDAGTRHIATLIHLLRRDAATTAPALVSQELPVALGLDPDTDAWTEQAVDSALGDLAAVCRLLKALPKSLRERVLAEIGQIFASDIAPAGSGNVLAQMRDWRAAYVILPNDPLSPDARLLYDSLGGVEDDTDGLLLQRLPTRIAEVRAAYGSWPRWSMRDCYLSALRAAANEIAERGKVGAGSESAGSLWHEFRKKLGALGDDELRWIVKTFRDEFQQ